MHMILNFQVNQTMFYAMASGDCRPLMQGAGHHPHAARAVAVGDLPAQPRRAGPGAADRDAAAERVPALRPRTEACSCTAGASAGGWRRMVGGDPRRMELAASLLFALPGTPVMRYGDEIGMGDDRSCPTARPCARPCSGPADRHGGFSTGRYASSCPPSPGPVRLPAGQRRRPAPRSRVAAERDTNGSSAPARNARSSAGATTRSWPPVRHNVLAVRCEWRNNAVLSVHNFSSEAREVRLKVPKSENLPLTNLLEPDDSPPAPDGPAPDHVAPLRLPLVPRGPADRRGDPRAAVASPVRSSVVGFPVVRSSAFRTSGSRQKSAENTGISLIRLNA